MKDQNIKCPSCGHEFEIEGAITERVKAAVDAKAREGEAQARKDKAKLDHDQERIRLREKEIDEEVARGIADRTDILAKDASKKARADLEIEIKSRDAEIAEKDAKIQVANKRELEMRQRENRWKEKIEENDLVVARRMDEERSKIAKAERAKFDQQNQLKMREKDQQLESMKTQISELQRRAEVGSQERQGEALEDELIETLRSKFPFDKFDEIKKGARGADVMQVVRTETGKLCGKILWESKNTKEFSKPWIDKLKKDQQEAGADLAVLMTMALPAGVEHFDFCNEVWVTDFGSSMNLCVALRQMMIGVDRERLVAQHKDGAKDLVYGYFTGQEFAGRIRMIASAYQQMQTDLESEKRSLNKIWKKREKQIGTVLDNLSGMHGELEGLLQGQTSLPGVEAFSLAAIAGSEEDDD